MTTRTVLGLLAAAAAVGAMGLTACGGTDDRASAADRPAADRSEAPASDDLQVAAREACDLTEPAAVAEIFGGTPNDEHAGAARNCEYVLQGGAVPTVHVFTFGSDDTWDAQRGILEETSGKLTEVDGVGDEAVAPETGRGNYLVVRHAGVIFAVQAFTTDLKADHSERVRKLARQIADDLG
jgi:hypothetical protein